MASLWRSSCYGIREPLGEQNAIFMFRERGRDLVIASFQQASCRCHSYRRRSCQRIKKWLESDMSNITNTSDHHIPHPIITTLPKDRRTHTMQVRVNRLTRYVQPTDTRGRWRYTGVSRHMVRTLDVFFYPVNDQEAIRVLELLIAIGFRILQADCLAYLLSLLHGQILIINRSHEDGSVSKFALLLLSPLSTRDGQSLIIGVTTQSTALD